MKILFDEDVPHKLARHLPRHTIFTVSNMEWGGIKNGGLLQLIESEGFEIFLTRDKNMIHQQRLKGRPFAVLVLSAINWPVIRPHIDAIDEAIDNSRAGVVSLIDCGEFRGPAKT